MHPVIAAAVHVMAAAPKGKDSGNAFLGIMLFVVIAYAFFKGKKSGKGK